MNGCSAIFIIGNMVAISGNSGFRTYVKRALLVLLVDRVGDGSSTGGASK